MTRKTFEICSDEIYSKPLKKNYNSNKTDVYHIDDIWILDIIDFKDYGLENIRGYKYFSVKIDNFSKFGLTVPL